MPKKNLRNVLSNLRERLGTFLEIERDVVALRMNLVEAIDCLTFAAHLAIAAQQSTTASERHRLLGEAVNLYQGPFLDGFQIGDAEVFDEWMRNERQRYHLLAMQAFSTVIASTIQQGTLLDGIHYASRLLTLEPTHEEGHRQLMLLLALDGQASAALAQYRTCQQRLKEEIGVEPSPETRQLYQRILAGEFSKPLAAPLPAGNASPQPASLSRPTRQRSQLPAELTGFVDRIAEIAQIEQRLADPSCRLLTLTGMGGVGKTRLALHVAHRYAASERSLSESHPPFTDGIYFAALADLVPGPQIENQFATHLANLLHIPLGGSRSDFMAASEQLAQALYDKDLLLLLDNCEHVPVASLIHNLLQQTQKLKLLVTSRTRLNLRGEQLIQLQGLATPDDSLLLDAPQEATSLPLDEYSAVRLFAQRVQAIVPDFTLDPMIKQTTLPAVIQICRLLHGLPLAIELAATWARLLPVEEIAQEIQQNLDFLDTNLLEAANDLLPQQRNLRAVFNHSWRLLNAAEQQALRRLAVFRGGFRRDAAHKVAGATIPLLASLIDKSLIQRVDPTGNPQRNSQQNPQHNPQQNEMPGSAVRYELPALIRQYAAEQLVEAAELDACQARHAAYLAEFLAARRSELLSTKQQEAVRMIQAEIENVRAAWQWLIDHLQTNQADLIPIEAQVRQGFDTLFHFYDMRSWFQEGEAVFAQLAQRLPQVDPSQPLAEAPLALWRLQAQAQARHAWFLFHLGRSGESRYLFEQSLHHLRQLQAEAETIFTLNYLGALLRHMGEFAEAERLLQDALKLAQSHQDALAASIALNILGQLAFLQGNYAQAQQLCHQAFSIKQTIGDRWGMTYSLLYLGRVTQAMGDAAAAQKLFEESLLICRQIGDQRGEAIALQNLADVAYLLGQRDLALARKQESLQIYRRIGNRSEVNLLLAQLEEWSRTG